MARGEKDGPQNGSGGGAPLKGGNPTGSISESLAHGLASKMASAVREANIAAVGRRRAQPPTVKRAAAYRAARELLRASVPGRYRGFEYEVDESGKNKNGYYMLDYWDTADAFERLGEVSKGSESELMLISAFIRARDVSVRTAPICAVSRHALMRLFYRLRTADESAVMAEIQGLASVFWSHLMIMRQASIEAELLVPSAKGAFVVVLDARRPGEFIAKTWMSDERMMDNVRRLHAVFVARAENGLVVNHTGSFPVISGERLKAAGVHDLLDPTAQELNAMCDALSPGNGLLPWSWRFRDWRAALRQQIESAGYEERLRKGSVDS